MTEVIVVPQTDGLHVALGEVLPFVCMSGSCYHRWNSAPHVCPQKGIRDPQLFLISDIHDHI